MLVRVLCVCTLVIAFVPSRSQSQEADLCQRIFESVTDQDGGGPDLLSLLRSLWSIGPPQVEEGSDQPDLEERFSAGTYWVTIDQGTAWAPDCSDGQVRSFYDPPGLMVEVVSSIDDFSVCSGCCGFSGNCQSIPGCPSCVGSSP
jgi:hypothetical protein